MSESEMKIDLEALENFEEYSQKLQMMANDDNKITELLNLVNFQRKTITSLSKKNADLQRTVKFLIQLS